MNAEKLITQYKAAVVKHHALHASHFALCDANAVKGGRVYWVRIERAEAAVKRLEQKLLRAMA